MSLMEPVKKTNKRPLRASNGRTWARVHIFRVRRSTGLCGPTMAVSGLVGQAVRAGTGVSRSNGRCSAAPAPTQVSTQDHRAPVAATKPRRIVAADGPAMEACGERRGSRAARRTESDPMGHSLQRTAVQIARQRPHGPTRPVATAVPGNWGFTAGSRRRARARDRRLSGAQRTPVGRATQRRDSDRGALLRFQD